MKNADHRAREHKQSRAESLRPSTQLHKKSHLGKLMAQSKSLGACGIPPSSSSSSDSDSDSDSKAPRGRGLSSSSLPRGYRKKSGQFGIDDEFLEPSSADEDDSPEVKRSKKKAQREYKARMFALKLQMSASKAREPAKYDGTPDNSKLYRFMLSTNQYLRDVGLAHFPHLQVGRMINYLDGRALDFFIQRVGANAHRWTIEQFYSGLIDYCFPVNYASRMRTKFKNCKQGSRSVRDYVFEMLELKTIIGDLPDRICADQLWSGARYDIRRRLRLDGYDPESSSFDDIAKRMEIIEQSEEAARYEGVSHREPESSSQRSSGDRSSRRGPRRFPRNNNNNNTIPTRENQSQSSQPLRANATQPDRQQHQHRSRGQQSQRPQHRQQRSNGPRSRNTTSNRSAQELDRLRAGNKCFQCEEVGHLARDCPQRNSVPRIAARAATVAVDDVDTLRELASSTQMIDMNSIRFLAPEADSAAVCLNSARVHLDDDSQSAHSASDTVVSGPLDGPAEIREDAPAIDNDPNLADFPLFIFHPAFSARGLVSYYQQEEVDWWQTHGSRILVPPRIPTNDFLAAGLAMSLAAGVPYPHDRHAIAAFRRKRKNYQRFYVYRIAGEQFLITDHWHNDELILSPQDYLSPYFDVRAWFAFQRTLHFGERPSRSSVRRAGPDFYFDPSLFELLAPGVECFFDPTLFDVNNDLMDVNEQQIPAGLHADDEMRVADAIRACTHRMTTLTEKLEVMTTAFEQLTERLNRLDARFGPPPEYVEGEEPIEHAPLVAAEFALPLPELPSQRDRQPYRLPEPDSRPLRYTETEHVECLAAPRECTCNGDPPHIHLRSHAIQVPAGSYGALQRNASYAKDFERLIPRPMVVVLFD